MTEKDYNQQQRTNKTMKKQQTAVETKVSEEKKQESAKPTTKDVPIKEDKNKKEQKKVRKDFAVVNGVALSISTKDAVAICKFIRKKTIEKALAELDEVLKLKRAIPMVGEIPHRKGKGMMSGRYPIYAVKEFIKMIKELKANSNANGLEEPIISEAVPNMASRPHGRFGAVRKKRTHVRLKATEKKKVSSEQIQASSNKNVRREERK